MGRPNRVLFVTPYPEGRVASQRFRHEHFTGDLKRAGWEVVEHSFWSHRAMSVLYQSGMLSKFGYFAGGVVRRLLLLASVRRTDIVFVHRDAIPVGPPWFEWCCVRFIGARLVYDFDDAIWLYNASSANPLAARFRRSGDVATRCRLASRVSCGNAYLAAYAARWCDDVVVNPTIVDTEHKHVKPESSAAGRPVIGWTGTHSTLPHLKELLPALLQLRQQAPFELRVICDVAPDFEFDGLNYVRWQKESEISDLAAIDIGLMPLPDTEWAKGKCGFKLIQYMSLEIPALASPVGVNADIVTDGENGFLCTTTDEWVSRAGKLLGDPELRNYLGRNARRTIIERYSVPSAREGYLATIMKWGG